MLNELYELSLALQHHNLLDSTTHPDISMVGKGDCLLFELDSNGVPRNVRLLKKGEMPALWKHSKGNHNNFPAIRIQKPFLSISESKKIDDVLWNKSKNSEKIELLKSLDFTSINPQCSEIKISEWSLNALEPVIASEQPEVAALKQLINVFPRENQKDAFITQIIQLMIEKMPICDHELLDYFKELLVGKLDVKTGRYKVGCMTYYDVYERMNYKNLVMSKKTCTALIKVLNEEHCINDSEKLRSPLSGQLTSGVGQKYPNPNLPLIGQTYLYSKKLDLPCLSRYSMTGANAFQAGKDEISKINDAIAFLTDESRKNKTWRAISDSNREKPNLLLAYLTDAPDNDALLASILGDPYDFEDIDDYKLEKQSIYESLCKQVIDELKPQENKESKICLILLESLDPGRKQVVYESTFTVERLCENLSTWKAAFENCPTIIIDRKIPAPNELCKLFKMSYTRSGNANSIKQSDVSLREIYSLYMPAAQKDRNPELIDRFMQLAFQKSFYLFSDIGSKYVTNNVFSKQMIPHVKNASIFISLFAILLHFKGIRKETYMYDAPFNIGQLLKLSDMLHKEYTIYVRNGGNKSAPLPPQLMGNELLSIACENPNEALVRLKDRIRIYQAWAFTSVGETSRLAKWVLNRFEEVSRKIGNDIPESFTTAQSAQVLLGYLADIPYEKQKENKENKEENN